MFGRIAFGALNSLGMSTNYNAQAASQEAHDASRRATDTAGHVRDIEERLDRMALACTALWELLRERTSLTEEDLMKKVQEIDLRDGVPDGKISKKELRRCSKCGRTMSPRHRRCLYCGNEDLQAEVFDATL